LSKTSIELFAGAGGLALGLEQAGFEHLAMSQKVDFIFVFCISNFEFCI